MASVGCRAAVAAKKLENVDVSYIQHISHIYDVRQDPCEARGRQAGCGCKYDIILESTAIN